MKQDLSGKVATIAGGASGIGLACARALVEAKVLVDRSGEGLAPAAAELGPLATPLVVDLIDPAIVDQAGGRLDIFHANAGASVGGEVIEGDANAWDRVLNLNVDAVFRSIHAVLPHMAEQKAGDRTGHMS